MITEFNAITPEYMKYRIQEETEQYKQEIERLNNIINEIKRCNSDYYNMINTLSSKLSRIREYVTDEEREFSLDCYYRFKDIIEFDEILEIINDNKIILGSDKE